MHRPTVYLGSQIRDVDILTLGQSAMVGLAKLASATLGTTGVVNGFAATPGSGLTVNIGAGEVYQSAPLEATAISELAQDTSHTIVKQGISLDATLLSGFAAPASAGPANVYLIEAQYQDFDTGSTLLSYMNVATYPAGLPYSGPGNTGAPQSTIRQGIAAFQVKGPSTTVPSLDSGWIGLYVVTVAYGQSAVVAGSIATYGSNGVSGPAAAIPTTIPAIPGALQQSQWVAWPDTGTIANAYVIAPQPPLTTRTPGGTRFLVQFANPNTGGCSLNDGLGTVPLYQSNGAPLGVNYITQGQVSEAVWDGYGYQMVPGPAAWAAVNADYSGAALFNLGFVS